MWNTPADLRFAIPSGIALRADDACGTAAVVGSRARCAWHVARALRPHHWTKNLLLFAAVLLGQNPLDPSLLMPAVMAFVAFSLCASAAYLVNDVLDIDADRRHPTKRNRPFAAGALPATWGVPLAALALSLGLLAGTTLPLAFTICLLLYVLMTSLYSTWLKRLFAVDVITLATLYTLRLVAGGFATGTPVSNWLLAACMLLFLSLALAKRSSELKRLVAEKKSSSLGRGYVVNDLGLLTSLGQICGYLAGLALTVYLSNGAMGGSYKLALLLVCPIYFYWITRFWRKANQGEALEDPVVFVLRDPVSIALGCGLLVWLQVPTIA